MNSASPSAVSELPLYGRLTQFKVRYILEALDAFNFDRKSEVQDLPPGLEIEHVLPRAWTTHWPLPEEILKNPIEAHTVSSHRGVLLNTIGNLTLISGSLNPAPSNSPWTTKRPELLKFSKLNLTQYFHGVEADTWDEAAIRTRTNHLTGQLVSIWPDTDRSATLAADLDAEPDQNILKRRKARADTNSKFEEPWMPSAELAAVVGNGPLRRTEIVAKLWAYIVEKHLQDTANKRMINSDDKLFAIFKIQQVSMFQMAGIIGEHLEVLE